MGAGGTAGVVVPSPVSSGRHQDTKATHSQKCLCPQDSSVYVENVIKTPPCSNNETICEISTLQKKYLETL